MLCSSDCGEGKAVNVLESKSSNVDQRPVILVPPALLHVAGLVYIQAATSPLVLSTPDPDHLNLHRGEKDITATVEGSLFIMCLCQDTAAQKPMKNSKHTPPQGYPNGYINSRTNQRALRVEDKDRIPNIRN